MTLLAVAVQGRGLVDPAAPVFSADDESLLRGSVAFETMPTYGGVPFLLDRHLERLHNSIAALALPPAEDVGLADVLEATFPGGSITGAPKIAAVDHIAKLEPVGRGASMGALGTLLPNGDFDLALTIRTFAIADGTIHLWVGGGIVWDSEPDAEIEESWVKARPLLEALA